MKTLAVIAYIVLIMWGIYKLTAVRNEQPEDWLDYHRHAKLSKIRDFVSFGFPASDSHAVDKSGESGII